MPPGRGKLGACPLKSDSQYPPASEATLWAGTVVQLLEPPSSHPSSFFLHPRSSRAAFLVFYGCSTTPTPTLVQHPRWPLSLRNSPFPGSFLTSAGWKGPEFEHRALAETVGTWVLSQPEWAPSHQGVLHIASFVLASVSPAAAIAAKEFGEAQSFAQPAPHSPGHPHRPSGKSTAFFHVTRPLNAAHGLKCTATCCVL